MGAPTGNPCRPKRPLCIADLCQAIANGQILPVVEGSCYQISSQDLRRLSEAPRPHQQELPAALLLDFTPALDGASDVSCLA
jgi:hypothetical protein